MLILCIYYYFRFQCMSYVCVKECVSVKGAHVVYGLCRKPETVSTLMSVVEK